MKDLVDSTLREESQTNPCTRGAVKVGLIKMVLELLVVIEMLIAFLTIEMR